MFGYVGLDKDAPAVLKNNFIKHYCFLCRSLGYHYGQVSRIFVSYDVTFFLMLLSDDNLLSKVDKITCWKKTKELSEAVKTDLAKKVAAFNLTLMAGVLCDHIRDGDKSYTKVIYKLMNRTFKKIEKEYPFMWNTVISGYDKMSEVEKNNGSVYDIQNCFAQLVETVAKEFFEISDQGTLSYLIFVAKHLYFLDTVDDLDKDVKSSAYNPLKYLDSKSTIANERYIDMSEIIRTAIMHLKPLPDKGLNAMTVSRIVHYGMPEKLFGILKGELKK